MLAGADAAGMHKIDSADGERWETEHNRPAGWCFGTHKPTATDTWSEMPDQGSGPMIPWFLVESLGKEPRQDRRLT